MSLFEVTYDIYLRLSAAEIQLMQYACMCAANHSAANHSAQQIMKHMEASKAESVLRHSSDRSIGLCIVEPGEQDVLLIQPIIHPSIHPCHSFPLSFFHAFHSVLPF